MSSDRRGFGRDHSFARIMINVEGRVGYVADVSDKGFKGLFPEPFNLDLGRAFVVGVSFEELGLKAFDIRAVARWMRLESGSQEVGFELLGLEMDEEERKKFNKIRIYYADGHPRST
jgi:hypothetical protein